MKRKTITTILIIISILSLIPLSIELFTILTTEYMMICSKTDREYIQKVWYIKTYKAIYKLPILIICLNEFLCMNL